ncbi:MAG: symmetrical bis(5'-nucleosyl)-tetraphosphatase [Gammaproteobacteria bacterium]|nr:symmetrical bis(5'-nucleosyl)-tetraphosphatase [Gammaproteobacteria bacterium]
MPTYAIGDVQGCYEALRALLDKIEFSPSHDTLWFAGDLVNRGPQSLEVLRFVSKLPHVVSVLGNHDFTLLALAHTDIDIPHTMHDILKAPDRADLINWLRHRPLFYHDEMANYVLVHAGITPQWTLSLAQKYAKEVEACLRSAQFEPLLANMFGNAPNYWNEDLVGWERYRFIINALTRIRYCNLDGSLELDYKGPPQSAPAHLMPWYKFAIQDLNQTKILFGHWAALEGKVEESHVFPLDTGCVWGNALTALRLEDNRVFNVACSPSD